MTVCLVVADTLVEFGAPVIPVVILLIEDLDIVGEAVVLVETRPTVVRVVYNNRDDNNIQLFDFQIKRRNVLIIITKCHYLYIRKSVYECLVLSVHVSNVKSTARCIHPNFFNSDLVGVLVGRSYMILAALFCSLKSLPSWAFPQIQLQ